MSYPPLPSNGETSWGDKFRAWADSLQGRKVEGTGMALHHDTSIGTRVFLTHPGGSTMIYGDTGWRNITGLLINGWTTGSLRIRRVNATVEIQGRLNATDKTDDNFIQIPSGFQFTAGSFSKQTRIGSWNLVLMAGGGLNSTSTSAFGDIHEQWFTTQPWPATLPGTPL